MFLIRKPPILPTTAAPRPFIQKSQKKKKTKKKNQFFFTKFPNTPYLGQYSSISTKKNTFSNKTHEKNTMFLIAKPPIPPPTAAPRPFSRATAPGTGAASCTRRAGSSRGPRGRRRRHRPNRA
jgi:hypothetical protein